MDPIERTDGLYVGLEGYAVYYPWDQFLVVCHDKFEADLDVASARTKTDPMYQGATVVRISITDAPA